MLASLRIAFRSLIKTPGFTSIALITLALGIGVNASMYSFVNTLLFGSAPYPQADRIVRIFGTSQSANRGNFSLLEIEELRQHTTSFESITAPGYWNNTLSEAGGTAERLVSVDATADFFTTFGMQPAQGRPHVADEQAAGRNRVAIISHAFWQRHFGGDSSVLHRVVRLNAEPVEIIGIMPAKFEYLMLWGEVDLWRPITVPSPIISDRNNRFFQPYARLKPGVTLEQATAEISTVLARWARDYPQINTGRGARLASLATVTMDETSRFFIWMLYGLSAFVLLIACANLANLQLARATARAKDLAIRSALGASRARLLLHQLVESVLLAGVGGGLGLMVAGWMNDALGGRVRLGSHLGLALPLDARVIAATALASLSAAVVFGFAPAWFASRTDVVSTLKQQSRGSTGGRGQSRMRHTLIVAEIALALALLGGASVMIRGFDSFLKRDPHWDTTRVITAAIHLPEQATYDTPDKRRAAMERLAQEIARIPGAEHTSICSSAPVRGYSSNRKIRRDNETFDDPQKQPNGGYILVAPGFFETMGIPLLEGRLFAADIQGDSPPQVVIGQTLARQFWPGESAIGKILVDGDGVTAARREVIGVVRDIDFPGNFERPRTMLQVYKPFVHEPWGYMNLLVRGANPSVFAGALRHIADGFDPDVLVREVLTIPELVEQTQHNTLLVGETMGYFAALGLALAGVGLFGVISHLVALRTSEFGIRIALGASPADVMKLVLVRGVRLALIGVVIGLALAAALNVALGQVMPRVVKLDFVSLLGTALVLFGVALFACWLPARRATKVDPLTALRAE